MKKTSFLKKALLLSVLLILFSFAFSFGSEALVSLQSANEPVKVFPKNAVSILLKALPGTVAGTGELKESGTITSMTPENTFTVKAFSKNPEVRVHIAFTAQNGKSGFFADKDEFVYICETPGDYTVLTVAVFDESEKQLAEYVFTLRYEETGFWRRAYWRVRGNEIVNEVVTVLKTQMPLAVWETFYVTLLSSFIAFLIGLPLGVLLVAGDKNGIAPLPQALMSALNVIINLLRSIPFLILMILVIPISRAIIGTSVGTMATVVPLVFAAFPFVARLVESSLREINPNIIEAAQSMGASPFQIIVKVMIPESVPSLVSNMTIAVTTILGYSAMSGVIGGGGLGKIAINYGYYRYQFPTMVVAVILLVLLVQLFQSFGTSVAKRIDKRLKTEVKAPKKKKR